MEQRVFIRITIPAIEINEAVEIKRAIDVILKDHPGATCELSIMTRTPEESPSQS